jgi:hypothetical protein
MYDIMVAPALLQVIAPLGLGVILHLCFFLRGEWHLYAGRIFVAHALAFALLLARQLVYAPATWYAVAPPIVAYLCGILGSMGVYRVFFHRLRSFPGPRLAALSKLWHVWHCRDAQNHVVLDSLRKYGDFVRTGPSEVTIFHPAALEYLNAPQNHNTRSDWYDLLYPTVGVFSRDPAIHATRAKVWNKAMAPSPMRQYYQRIVTQVLKLEGIIESHKSKPLVINDLIYQLTFDVINDVGFSITDMDSKDGAAAIGGALSIIGPTIPATWVNLLAFSLFPKVWRFPSWFKFYGFAIGVVQRRVQVNNHIPSLPNCYMEKFGLADRTAPVSTRVHRYSFILHRGHSAEGR